MSQIPVPQALSERERLQRLLVNFHDTLIVLLIALRPLVWDGDAASPANLVYLALILLALLITAAEFIGGLRTQVRWSWTGFIVAVLVAALVPAALRAPIPADGSAFIWQLVLHLGLGAYLLQVVPGRERVAWSALVAGLGAEVVIGWVQGLYVLPKMAAGTALGDAAVAAEGIAPSDLAERIQRGGWFGTFTLSNTLAAWLLVALIPMVGTAWRSRSILAWSIAIAGSGLFLATRSKGALIAVALAAGVWWMLAQRRWWRWLPVPLGILAITAMFVIPGGSDGVNASARVRWGYWSGAVTLVREAPFTGHGIGAFAERSSGVMPLWAEPSRLVHNEPLEMAVVAGIPLAVLLVAVLLLIAWPRATDRAENPVDEAPRLPLLAPCTLIFVTGYLSLLGMLDGNLGWWPGGDSLLGQGAWGLLVGVGMAAMVLAAGRMPLPTGWWLRLALAALSLHTLIDFDLHSFAVIGTVIPLAIIAGGAQSGVPSRAHQQRHVGRAVGAAFLVLVVFMGVGWVRWAHAALDLRNAQDLVRALRLTRDPAHVDEGFATLAAQLGMAEPPMGDRRGRNEVIAQAVAAGLSLSAEDPTIAVQLIGLLPPSPERLAQLDALYPRVPHHLPLARLRAQDHLAAGRWHDAITEMRRGVALAPAYIPAHQELEVLLGQIADRDSAHAAQWRSERDQAAAERAAIEPIVDYRNRGK